MQLWGCNSTLSTKSVVVVLESFNLNTSQRSQKEFKVELAPNASTEIWKGDVPDQPIRTNDAQVPEPIIVQARLYDPQDRNTVLARYANWPEPWKYLEFPDANLQIKVTGDEIELSADKPIKGVILDTAGDDDECEWSDQAVDLFPGDVQVITAKGLKGRKVTARFIGDGSA
jgi:beta-mannosidase